MARALGGTTSESFKRAADKIARFAGTASRGLIPRGLYMIGEEIMTDIKASRVGAGVPRDRGILAGSGKVTPMNSKLIELSFGSAAAPYALVQHEVLTYHHKLGEARYLVRGIERWRPGNSAAVDALRENITAAAAALGKTP